MKNTHIHNKTRIVFSRWSRKAYAVFASLGKEVAIGHVAVGIADCAYAKSCFVDVADMGMMDGENDKSGAETFALLSELEMAFSNLLETLFAAFAIVTLKNDDSQNLAVNDMNYGKSRIPLWGSPAFFVRISRGDRREKTQRAQSFLGCPICRDAIHRVLPMKNETYR